MLDLIQIRDKTYPLSVLIVDDDEEILESMTTLLSQFFKNLSTANNGADAFELLKNETFDILFTDIQMPIMDGLTLIQLIKDNNMQVYSVAVSGCNDLTEKQLKSFDSYVIKPMVLNSFIDVLTNFVNEKDL